MGSISSKSSVTLRGITLLSLGPALRRSPEDAVGVALRGAVPDVVVVVDVLGLALRGAFPDVVVVVVVVGAALRGAFPDVVVVVAF